MAITAEDIKWLEEVDKVEPYIHCLRAQVACMIVKDGELLVSHGNDWLLPNNCSLHGCIRDMMQIPSGQRREICYGICAEQWCISIAAEKGVSLRGATLYCTKHPCRVCSGLIVAAGIKRVVYQEGYPEALPGSDVLKDNKITFELAPPTIYKSPKVSKSHTI